MIQISQRCIQILWYWSYLVNYGLFPCCPIFFSLTTACAKSGYLVDLPNYLSFHEHPVNYTRGIYIYRYCPPPRSTVYFLEFSGICSVFLVFCRPLHQIFRSITPKFQVENRLQASTRGLAYRRSKCPTDVVP